MPERRPLWTWPWWRGTRLSGPQAAPRAWSPAPTLPVCTSRAWSPGPYAPRVHTPGHCLHAPMLPVYTPRDPVSSPHAPCVHTPGPGLNPTLTMCTTPVTPTTSSSPSSMRGFSNLESLSEPHRSAPEPQLHEREGHRGQREAGQEGGGQSLGALCVGGMQVRRRLGRRAGAAWAPGDVDEDEPLDAGQLHLLLLHLEPQGPVQAAGVADLLQPDPHIHALVVEPGRGLSVTRGPSPRS